MYQPDGFASLVCLMRDQCFFLAYQEPFVALMRFLHGNYIAFFLLQAITWFALIVSIYFLAKQLNTKHLFLTPFLLLFGGSLFVDNYVGNFENDYIAIVLFIVAFIFYTRNNKNTKWIAVILFELGTAIWMWIAYFRIPNFFSNIAEENWWAQILAWNLLTPIYLLAVGIAILSIYKKKDSQHFAKLMLVSFCFPKLWFFAIPMLLKIIETGLTQIDFKENYLFWITIIVFGLLVGQTLRVTALTYEAWSFDTSTTNCFTVNHEYLARLQGKSLYYNQAPIDTYNECLQKENSGAT